MSRLTTSENYGFALPYDDQPVKDYGENKGDVTKIRESFINIDTLLKKQEEQQAIQQKRLATIEFEKHINLWGENV